MPDDNRLPTNQSLINLKDSIDLLTANINRTASNIPYDSNLTIKGKIDEIDAKTANDILYSSGVSVKDKIDEIISELELTNLVNLSVNLTSNYFIIAGITNEQNQDGIHVYISTSSSSAKKIIVYKRENGTTTELYSLS